MKKLGISLATATILASTTFANETKAPAPKQDEISPWVKSMKIDGQFKLWYQTMDHDGASSEEGFFKYHKGGNEWGNIEAMINMHGEANDHLKYKMSLMSVSDIGMQGNFVAKETTRPRQVGAANGTEAQPFWIHEAYLDYVFTKNTDVKFGRMELDTPLAFTERWNATANSFEAIVAVNTDVPDTVLIGAWVAKGNGATNTLVHAPQVFGSEATFNPYMAYDEVGNAGGALAFAAINKSIPNTPVQAWFYNIYDVAQAVWVQADTKIDLGGLKAGVQLIGASVGARGKAEDLIKSDPLKGTDFLDEDESRKDTGDTTALAMKVSTKVDMFSVYGAVSQIGEGNLPVANTATHFKKTKIPTASIFSDGMVAAQPDTTAWKVGGSVKFDGIGSVSASYAGYNVGENKGYLNPNFKVSGPASMGVLAQNRGEDIDLNEFDLVFATKIKDLSLKAMYINVSKTYVPAAGGDYGNDSNQIIRVVGTLKF
jgi:imipenem/basic amino acid-specific outer membrane pore